MAAVLFAVIFTSFRMLSASARNNEQSAAHLHNLNTLQSLLNTLIDAETGERGYIISGNREFLQPYHEAVGKMNRQFPADSLLRSMPGYVQEIGGMYVQVGRQLDLLNEMVRKKQENRLGEPEAHEKHLQAKKIMDSIRATIDRLYNSELARLQQLNDGEQSRHQWNYVRLALCALISLLLAAAFYYFISRSGKLQEELNEELAIARNMVTEAARSRSHFLTTMSHELRTPMNGVLGMTSMLMQTPLSDEQKKYASTIHRSGVELLAVINDVIDFSKIEAGIVSLEVAPVSVKATIDEAISILAPEQRDIAIHYTIADEVPAFVDTDASRLRQILLNIISNSMKLSGHQAVDILVKRRVRDNGVQELIFEVTAFEGDPAARPAFTRKEMSAGLGLSISTRLISLLGGNIKIDTNTRRGSSIVFSIRAQASSHQPQADPAQPPAPAESAGQPLSSLYPLQILSVDDNEMNQLVITTMLSKMGYSIDTAVNGEDAYQKAVEKQYDVIFMDVFMPVMDGMEATRSIRKYYLHKTRPIIIGVTADSMMHQKSDWVEAGINDLLTKPYKPRDVQQLLLKWGAHLKES